RLDVPPPQTAQGAGADDSAVAADPGRSGDSMNRRTFLCGLTLGLLAAPLAAEAQQAEKEYRIGFLSSTVARSAPFFEAFFQALRVLGYIESKNLTVDFRTAEGKAERLAELAADLVGLKVDLIVASGPEAVLR